MDKDNDDGSGHCAQNYGSGGWWYDGCGYSGLNDINFANGVAPGAYDGISWYLFDNDKYMSLNTTTMSIIPSSTTNSMEYFFNHKSVP